MKLIGIILIIVGIFVLCFGLKHKKPIISLNPNILSLMIIDENNGVAGTYSNGVLIFWQPDPAKRPKLIKAHKGWI